MLIDITSFLIVLGVPSAITGLCFWAIQSKLTKRDFQRDEQDKLREKNEILLIKSVGAAIALGEATAIAMQRGKCNGEMEAALIYAQTIKNEQKDFLTEQGVKNMF